MIAYKLRPILATMCAAGLLLGGLLTTSAQQATATPTAAPTATSTPAPSETPLPTATYTPTPTPQGTQLILQIATGADDVNESSGQFVADAAQVWVGNGGTTSGQYLGLHFTHVAIPAGSRINAAHLEVYITDDEWIRLSYDIAAEAADNSAAFTADNPPSKRQLTAAVATHESDDPWLANTMYPLNEMGAVVQEVVSRPGWQTGNSLSVIAVGTEYGGDFGRKFLTAFETDPKQAIRLVIDFSPNKAALSPTGTADPCGTLSLPARLKVGQAGQVLINTGAPTTPVNIRKAASVDAERTGRLAQGVSFTVIDGPTCADGVAWFKVRYGDNNLVGWLAEGQDNLYFVEPVK